MIVQRLRLERLEADEAKLLQAHYSDAISMPLMQAEQRRIAQERADAGRIVSAVSTERSALENALDAALGRVSRCDEVYASGSDLVRRELAFAVFERIWVNDFGVAGVDLAQPFAQLLDPSLPERLDSEQASLDSAVGELVAPAFDVEACRPLDLRPDLERPRSLLPWETKNTARVGRCSNVNLLVGVLAEYWNSADQLERLIHKVRRAGERPESAARRAARRSRQLTEEEVDRMVGARVAGAEINDLANEFGIHRATVIAHLTRRGVEHRRRQGRSLSAARLQRAGELYASGANLIEVGNQFDVDRRYLRKALPAAGFELRRPGRQTSADRP